jgi:hypothetical protein
MIWRVLSVRPYDLENEKAFSSEMGAKLRAAEARLGPMDEKLDMYKKRAKEADKAGARCAAPYPLSCST